MVKTIYPRPKRLEKISREEQLALFFDLINAIRIVNSPTDTALLLRDLLTAKEIKNLSKRLRIAKLLLADKTQQEIVDHLQTSFATVTKVNLWLNQGGEGLRKVIKRLPQKYNMPDNLPPGPIEYYGPQVIYGLLKASLASRQKASLEKFMESVEEKRILDKSLKEAFNQEFANLPRKRTK